MNEKAVSWSMEEVIWGTRKTEQIEREVQEQSWARRAGLGRRVSRRTDLLSGESRDKFHRHVDVNRH